MSPTTIDFSAYRTPELAERVGNALGANLLSQLARSFTIWLVVVTAINLGFLWMLFPNQTHALLSRQPTAWTFHLVAIPIAIFNLMGTMAVITLIRTTAIMQRNVMSLVGILFEVTGVAYRDMKSVAKGDQQLPSAAEVTQHVYDDVLTPLVEAYAGWGSRLGLWLFDQSVGRAVRRSSDEAASDEAASDEAASDEATNDEGPTSEPEPLPIDPVKVPPPPEVADGDTNIAAPAEVENAEGAVRRNLRRVGWVMALLHTSFTVAACLLGSLSGAIPLFVVRLVAGDGG